MTYNYTGLAESSRRLIADKGQSVTINRIVGGTYDPNSSSNTPTSTAYTGVAVLLDYKLQEKGIGNEAGSLVQSGDKKLLLAPIGYLVSAPSAQIVLPEFEPNDTVTIGGVTWTVINAKAVNPAGTILIQELQIRK
jgi:hypothetical protein